LSARGPESNVENLKDTKKETKYKKIPGKNREEEGK